MLIAFSVHLKTFHPNFNIYMIIKLLLTLPPPKKPDKKKLAVSETFY